MNEEKKERQEEERRAELRVGAKAEILGLVAVLAKTLNDGATSAEEDDYFYALGTFNAAQRLVERLEIAAQRIN